MTKSATPARLAMAATAAMAACITPAAAQPINLLLPAPVPLSRGATPSGGGALTVPPLPIPPVADSAPPRSFLLAARTEVGERRYGKAEEALERAETRLLDRSQVSSPAVTSDDQRAVLDVTAARRALAARDRAATIQAIDAALAAIDRPVVAADVPPPPPVPVCPGAHPPGTAIPPNLSQQPPEPTVTYAKLPGHWKLDGATYVWVPPDRVKRRVQSAALVQGRYVWKDGAYLWVPAHYQN